MTKNIPNSYTSYLRDKKPEALAGEGLTLRSVFIGIVFTVFTAISGPYAITIVRTSEITWSYFPICVGLPFVLLIVANSCTKRLTGNGLNRSELITIVIMGLVSSGIPVFLVSFLFAIIATPYYGANDENNWVEAVHPLLPKWAIPSDEAALVQYFEGLPLDTKSSVPLDVWVGPLLWWFSMFAALFFLCLCLVVTFRRHWMETERLPFPVAEIPLLLTSESKDSKLPPIFHARLFWLGCSIPFLIICFNIASYFEPGLPRIPAFTGGDIDIIPGPIRQPRGILYFPIIGFAYLVATPVTLSVWVCYILVALEGSLLKTFHIGSISPDPFVIGGFETTLWQDWGAFVAMVCLAMWIARHHLMNVLRQISGTLPKDDHDEMLSYRTAIFGGITASLYLVGWFVASGMEPYVAALCLLFAIVIFLGITRIVTQSGVHYLTTPVTSQGMVLALTGTAVTPHTLMGLALTNIWCGDVQSIFMVSAAHAARLNTLRTHRRGLVLAMAISITVSFFTTSFFLLLLAYDIGALSLQSIFHVTHGHGATVFNSVVAQRKYPAGIDLLKLGYFGAGFLIYGIVAFLHYRLPWWPLHPVGLTIASTWMVRQIVFSVFIAWFLKMLVLRLGSVHLFGRLRPFFIGLPMGFFLGVGVSAVVDLIWFFGTGHAVLHG